MLPTSITHKRNSSRQTLHFATLVAMTVGLIVVAGPGGKARAQTAAGSTVGAEMPGFEVVSIRRSKAGEAPNSSVKPNEFVLTNTTLEEMIKEAYYPQLRWYWPKEKGLQGAPPWVGNEEYDIVAKVDRATAEKWKSLTYEQLIKAMKPALQATLEERCKLALHTTMEDRPSWVLVVGKHVHKLKETDFSKPLPHAFPLVEGGVMVSSGRNEGQTIAVFGAPMASLAQILSMYSSRLVFDKTGLPGRYDFVLSKRDMGSSVVEGTGGAALAPVPATIWDVEALGLMLKSAKTPTQILVVDHVERPSDN